MAQVRQLLFITISLFLTAKVEAASEPKRFCSDETGVHLEGETWTAADGCNTCTCRRAGISCTLMACAESCTAPNGDIIPVGESYSDGCNGCFCIGPNSAACTKMMCERKCRAPDGKDYYPGESFLSEDGCNTCTCDVNGLSSCTRMACIPQKRESLLSDFIHKLQARDTIGNMNLKRKPIRMERKPSHMERKPSA